MKRRYIICFDSLSIEESKIVTSCLKEKKLYWWHWIENVWFVVDKDGHYNAKEIRDSMKDISPQRLIVIELNEVKDTWAGVRARDPENKMFTWFKKTWKKI